MKFNFKHSHIFKYVHLLGAVFLLGIFISPFAGKCNDSNSFVSAKESNPLADSDVIKSAMVVQNALRQINTEVSPAVVRIETESTIQVRSNPFFDHFFGGRGRGFNQKRKQQGLGSGFIISKKGYIVTNYHVVVPNGRKADKLKVKISSGKVFSAQLIGSDKTSDLALLKIEGAKNLKAVHIGDSDQAEVGDFAIAIGNPFGLSSTFTFGVISSKSQEVKTDDGVGRIQTDAAINPGNSGGPLLNIKGEVIGINQMIYSRSGGSVGIGFAIPMNYAMSIIEKLKEGKEIKQGYIGIAIASQATKAQLKELGINASEKGLLVSNVSIGSPAWKSGLRPYDFILSVDGKKAKKFSILKTKVLRKGPGKKLKIKAIRDGKIRSFIVTIGEPPKQ